MYDILTRDPETRFQLCHHHILCLLVLKLSCWQTNQQIDSAKNTYLAPLSPLYATPVKNKSVMVDVIGNS